MPVNNQSGYLGLVLMLATLTGEMRPATETLPPTLKPFPNGWKGFKNCCKKLLLVLRKSLLDNP